MRKHTQKFYDDMGADITLEVKELLLCVPSNPPPGDAYRRVTNVYVENGKLRVEYEG
jgi:hypothetical protein